MKKTKIVNLGKVRDLLAEWEKVRSAIVSGHIEGWSATILGADDSETVYLGGVYKESQELALRAALRASAARVLVEDVPPSLERSGTA